MKPTAQQVLDEVIRLGTEHPDVVYEKSGLDQVGFCSYIGPATGPGEGCIIGQALQNLGWSIKELERIENNERYSRAGAAIGHIAARVFKSPDRNVIDRLGVIQGNQDGGAPWGEAIK